MPIVYDRTGRAYTVPEETAARLLSTGDYTLKPDERINVRDAAGGVSSVTGERYQRDPTLAPRSSEEELAGLKQSNREAKYDTIGGEAKAFFGGAIDTLSAGLWSPWEDEREVNPVAGGLGQVAGFVPGLFTGGAEANAVRLGAEALQAGKALTRVERLAQAAGKAYGYTAPGIATRVMRGAEALVPGAGAASRIARSAAGGAAFSTTDEALRQALDPDKEFSGEQLLHAAGWGAAFGGGGAAIADGVSAGKAAISKLRLSREAQKIDETAKLLEHRPATNLTDDATEWAAKVDLSKGPNGVKLADGIATLRDDVMKLKAIAKEAIHSPALARQAGIEVEGLRPLVDQANGAMRNIERMMVSDSAPVQRLSQQLHSVDELAQKLRPYSEARMPRRWTDDAVRGSFYKDMESRIAGLGPNVHPDLLAGERIAAHIGVGMPVAESKAVRDGLFSWLGKKFIGEKAMQVAGSVGLGGAAGVVLGEHLIEGAAGSLLGGGLKLAAGVAGVKLAAKAIQVAFRDPAVGGLIAGSTTSVLNRAHVLPGDRRTSESDPRRALRRFAERTRRVTPEVVASKTAASLSHMAGATPLSVAAAAETAARRHREIMAILDRVDPVATSPLGRQLPTAADARRVADVIRATATPNNFIVAALNGSLTPEMLAAAEAVFPATVQRFRQALLAQLAAVKDPSELPARTRRLVSMLLGPSTGGDPSSMAAYRSAMDESAQRNREGYSPTQTKAPAAPPGPVADNRLSTPAQRAAHPAGGR